MGVNIKFKEDPKLAHINLRKEGDEHEDRLAVDLKLSGLAKTGPGGELIQKLLGCEPHHALRFWDVGSDAEKHPDPQESGDGPEVVFHGMTEMKSWAQFRDSTTVKICGLVFRPSKVSKFYIKPAPGFTADLTFSVSISDIDNKSLNVLTEYLHGEVPCEIEGDPDLFDGEEG